MVSVQNNYFRIYVSKKILFRILRANNYFSTVHHMYQKISWLHHYIHRFWIIFFSVPLTVVSIFVSISNFVITSWRLEAKDHIAKEDNDPKNTYANKTSKKHYIHQEFVPMLTHILWTLTNLLIYSGSLVLLSLLGQLPSIYILYLWTQPFTSLMTYVLPYRYAFNEVNHWAPINSLLIIIFVIIFRIYWDVF